MIKRGKARPNEPRKECTQRTYKKLKAFRDLEKNGPEGLEKEWT
jgi:hypothetical protein